MELRINRKMIFTIEKKSNSILNDDIYIIFSKQESLIDFKKLNNILYFVQYSRINLVKWSTNLIDFKFKDLLHTFFFNIKAISLQLFSELLFQNIII